MMWRIIGLLYAAGIMYGVWRLTYSREWRAHRRPFSPFKK